MRDLLLPVTASSVTFVTITKHLSSSTPQLKEVLVISYFIGYIVGIFFNAALYKTYM